MLSLQKHTSNLSFTRWIGQRYVTTVSGSCSWKVSGEMLPVIWNLAESVKYKLSSKITIFNLFSFILLFYMRCLLSIVSLRQSITYNTCPEQIYWKRKTQLAGCAHCWISLEHFVSQQGINIKLCKNLIQTNWLWNVPNIDKRSFLLVPTHFFQHLR